MTSTTAAAVPPVSSEQLAKKRRRRPAGTPDPDAEVVSLPPQTLLESERYVCEICGQAFQREQNLQMHRRRHKVPWKLLKKEETTTSVAARKRRRVYVCPEPSCLHHEAGHALGDLVGIKKHYRRKHSGRRQWVCGRCDKGYAVQSDYKAHLKTCGTRGHTCDCGRVFSRVESFIEHQDACASRGSSQPACLSRTGSSSSPSTDTASNAAPPPIAPTTWPNLSISSASRNPKLELQLLPPAFTSKPNTTTTTSPSTDAEAAAATTTQLQLSLAPAGGSTGNATDQEEGLPNQLRAAAAEKALADEARRQAKRQLELARQELADATRIRQQAQAELGRAYVLRNSAAESINSVLRVTCHECRNRLHHGPTDNSLALSAVSDGERSRNSV